MNSLSTHLDDLLTVLRASADLDLAVSTPAELQNRLAGELEHSRPDLAVRVLGLDEWHAEVLAEFVADAHLVSDALDGPARGLEIPDDTRVG